MCAFMEEGTAVAEAEVPYQADGRHPLVTGGTLETDLYKDDEVTTAVTPRSCAGSSGGSRPGVRRSGIEVDGEDGGRGALGRRPLPREDHPGCEGRLLLGTRHRLVRRVKVASVVRWMILTVTLNAALDRTMTVPNFQIGFRHRATDTIILPGGKGMNVARGVKILGRPVIATGFAGGRKGEQILADLGAEGILSDFVRVESESRTYTAVIDSATGVVTEINEHGLEVSPEDFDHLLEKFDYLAKAADMVVLAGSLPRGLADDSYARIIQRLRRHQVTIFFYTYGDPLRLGIKAGPDFAFPKLVDAERVIGHEFHDKGDELRAAAQMQELGSGSVVDHLALWLCRAPAGRRRTVGRSSPGCPTWRSSRPWAGATRWWPGTACAMLEGRCPGRSSAFRSGLWSCEPHTLRLRVFSAADAEELAQRVEIEEVSAES